MVSSQPRGKKIAAQPVKETAAVGEPTTLKVSALTHRSLKGANSANFIRR